MKKILLSMLFAGTAMLANAQQSEVDAAKAKWIEYANTQGKVEIDTKILGTLASKIKVSGEKKKEEAPKAKATKEEELAILNAGLAHTDLAIEHPKTKEKAEVWGWRALIASRICLIDTVLANSIAKEKIAVDAIEKLRVLDTKKTLTQSITDAQSYIDNAVANRGMIAFEKKDYATAYEAFNQMVIKNPKDTATYFNAGLSAMLGKKYPEAYSSYKKALEVGYKDTYSIYTQLVAITANGLKDSVKYLDVLNEAAVKYPDSSFFVSRITDYYMKKGDIVKSQEMLNKLISQEPKNAVYHYLLGDTYFKQALAAQDKRTAMDQKKEKKAYDDMNATMMSFIDQALPHYKTALQLDPKYADAVDKLKSIYGFKSDTPNYEAMSKLLNVLDGK
ncbi:tetratricopeptide (TPR) repeat protein [Pedobacter sp. UYP24]